MKFGTRILDGREQAIVRGTDGAVRPLADVTEAAGLGRINDVLGLVQACDQQPDLLDVAPTEDSVEAVLQADRNASAALIFHRKPAMEKQQRILFDLENFREVAEEDKKQRDEIILLKERVSNVNKILWIVGSGVIGLMVKAIFSMIR